MSPIGFETQNALPGNDIRPILWIQPRFDWRSTDL